jgi:hypothetical protein
MRVTGRSQGLECVERDGEIVGSDPGCAKEVDWGLSYNLEVILCSASFGGLESLKV